MLALIRIKLSNMSTRKIRKCMLRRRITAHFPQVVVNHPQFTTNATTITNNIVDIKRTKCQYKIANMHRFAH